MNKKELIKGILGQDGRYRAEHLLNQGEVVPGLVGHVACETLERRFSQIAHLRERIHLHPGTLQSDPGIFHVISQRQEMISSDLKGAARESGPLHLRTLGAEMKSV